MDAEHLVRNEVHCCMSHIVATLAKGYMSIDGKAVPDLGELAEQASELCAPVLDYEEAARQAGWRHIDGDMYGNGEERASAESWERLCEANDIDPYEWEIYEHWAVSTRLAEDLAEVGERVDMDFGGLCVWARTTTGQGIAGDSCIAKVCALIERRVAELAA